MQMDSAYTVDKEGIFAENRGFKRKEKGEIVIREKATHSVHHRCSSIFKSQISFCFSVEESQRKKRPNREFL